MYKAIFIDIDGTLRNDNKIISQRTIKAIKNIESLGINVILCTGRSRIYAERVSRECGASKYIITSNGAEIYDYQEKKVIYSNGIDAKACEKLYNLTIEYKTRFIMNVDNVMVVDKLEHNDGSQILLKEKIKDFLSKNIVLQFVILDTDFDKIKKIKESIEKIDGTKIINQSKSLIDNSIKPVGSIYYDVVKSDVSKGNAIIEFCKSRNISIEDTIGIGDGDNDIPMFEVVGYSVAMENSNENIKKIVNKIIKSNNEEGLDEYLEILYNNQNVVRSDYYE